MDRNEAKILYQKYRNGTCTPDEIAFLETAFNRYLESREGMPSKKQIADADRQMQRAIYEYVPGLRTPRRRTGYRYAAAAIILIGLAIGYTVWQVKAPQKTESMVVNHRNEPHIMPGGEKATLTLADGQVVHLSTEQEGIRIGADITYTDGSDILMTDSALDHTRHLVLHTPKAGEYQVMLQDGTKIWLNSESTLRYPMMFNGQNRVVQLTGEAYFEVAHDERPFTVVTDLGEIQVHGTAFNVKAYPEEQSVQTTLVTGSVSFATMRMRISMQPGELAVADISGKVETRTVDVAEHIGWRSGLYLFRESRLEDIMRELTRWYDVNVRYETEQIKDISFTGNLKRYSSINTFLKLLERTGEIDYRIEGKTLVLYKK